MSRGMAGMVLFISSEIMLFGGLFAGYFYVRNQAQEWPGVEHTVGVGLGGALTAILITSGVFAHFGVLGIKGGNRSQALLGVGMGIILGSIFIGGQIWEWFNLMDEGLTAKTGVYGSTFFILTGFHGAHVIAGICLLLVIFVRAWWGDFTPRRHLIADAGVLYWHFVDVVWVFLFTVLYVLGS